MAGSGGAIGGDQVRDDHEDDFGELAPEDPEAPPEPNFSGRPPRTQFLRSPPQNPIPQVVPPEPNFSGLDSCQIHLENTCQVHIQFPLLLETALPTETKVECGTSQSKSGTSGNLSNSGELSQATISTRFLRSGWAPLPVTNTPEENMSGE